MGVGDPRMTRVSAPAPAPGTPDRRIAGWEA